jgi:hypothetical protein
VKKLLMILFITMFTGITIFQYKENLAVRREPPSGKWGKEVLISSGNITDYPQIIKDNDRYIVAHVDGNRIKILATDNVGRKLVEKSFPAEGEMPRNVHVVTNGEKLNLAWIANNKDIKNIHSITLDNEFNVKGTDIIINVEDLKQVGNDLLVIGFKNSIKIVDYKLGKSSEISAPFNSLICGTKLGEDYIVAYLNDSSNFSYFLVKNGNPTEIRNVGVLKETTRTNYYSSAVAIEGDKGYIVAEYRYQGMYGGSKVMEFALDGSTYNTKETSNTKEVVSIYNIISYTERANDGVKFLAGGFRPLGKKAMYEDILELEVKDGEIVSSTPASRTRALSGFPSGYGDTMIFSDVVGIDFSNLYMTSSREDFKSANNINRNNEYQLAFIDTVQSILYTFVYLIAYGVLWIIPSLCIAAILSLIEYRFSSRFRKIIFTAVYFAAFLLKAYFIYSIMFKRFSYYLPQYLTPAIGLLIGSFISSVCFIYAFKKYAVNMERNAIPISFSAMFILDSWFTLFLFIPFIK